MPNKNPNRTIMNPDIIYVNTIDKLPIHTYKNMRILIIILFYFPKKKKKNVMKNLFENNFILIITCKI